jgi:transposase
VHGLLREHDIAVPNGAAKVPTAVRDALEDAGNEVPVTLRTALAEQLDRIATLQADTGEIEKRLTEEAEHDVAIQHYLTVPGVVFQRTR